MSVRKLAMLAVAALVILTPIAYGAGRQHTPHERKFSVHMKTDGCAAPWEQEHAQGINCYTDGVARDWHGGVADGFTGEALPWFGALTTPMRGPPLARGDSAQTPQPTTPSPSTGRTDTPAGFSSAGMATFLVRT